MKIQGLFINLLLKMISLTEITYINTIVANMLQYKS